MNTLITALLLAAQSTEPPDLSRFNQVMEMQRQATHSARYAEAERLGREAELIAQRLPDPDGSLIIMARNVLANTLAWQGRNTEAIELLEKTLPLAMKLSPHAHLTTALHLGASYLVSDRVPEAEPVLRRALRAAGPGEQREVLAARSILANIEALLGRRKAARAVFLEILAEQTRLLGSTHQQTLTTLSMLVLLSIAEKRYEEAEKLALRYIEDNAKAEVAGHPSNAFGHLYLGILDTKRKQYAKASQELRRALGILETAAGRRSPNFATVLDALAFVEIKLGHLAAALELRREAVSISEESFGPRHRVTALMLHKYADLQGRLHFRAEARQNRAKAVAIARESTVGSEAGRTIEWETFKREAGR